MAHPYAKKQEMHPGRKMAEKRYGTAHKIDQFARGGRTKSGKTNINIVIAPGSKDAGGPLPPPPIPPMMPKLPMAPPQGMEPPGGPMPPMKRGGKVVMKGGSETGQGRLDKAKAYKK